MRFLLDQGLPRSAVVLLAQIGFEADHVGDLGMATASDSEILAEAIRRHAVVVTLDADFHSILVRTGAGMPSVIRIRVDGLKGSGIRDILAEVVRVAGDDLLAGSVVSVRKHRVSVRRLPILPR